jgi:hypothetical protein
MPQMLKLSSRAHWWALITISIFLYCASADLTRPPVDLHQFRQTQTLSTIHNYFVSGINIFKPELDTNGSRSVVILEFPLYQAVVASLMRVFGYHEVIGRIVNIIASLATAIVLARVGEQYLKRGSFQVILTLFLLNPSTIFWSSTILIDPFAVMLAVTSIYFLCRWVRSKENFDYCVALAFGAFGCMVKLTACFVPFAAFGILFLFSRVASLKSKVSLGVLGFYSVCMASFLAWNMYSRLNHSVSPHEYTASSVAWYFGTMEQRLSLETWLSLGHRLVVNNLGFIVIFSVAFLFFSYSDRRKSLLISLVFLACSAIYLLVFVNLNYIHTYYQIPMNISIALIGSMLLVKGFQWLRRRGLYWVPVGTLVCGLTFFSNRVLADHWVDISPIKSPYQKSLCEYELGSQVRRYLHEKGIESDLVGIVLERTENCWNGPHALMYYLKERGFITRNPNDVVLQSEPLNLIIAFYQDRRPPKIEGWAVASRIPLVGSVRNFEAAMYTRDVPSEGRHDFRGEGLIEGDEAQIFGPPMRISDLKIPPYSTVKLKFSAKRISVGVRLRGRHDGYFVFRTYSGGYGYDQFRWIVLPNEGELREFSFVLETGVHGDYVAEFGQIRSGSWQIVGPVTVSYVSRFAEGGRVIVPTGRES